MRYVANKPKKKYGLGKKIKNEKTKLGRRITFSMPKKGHPSFLPQRKKLGPKKDVPLPIFSKPEGKPLLFLKL